MTSILLSDYIEPNRPYSQNELFDMQKKLHRDLKISGTIAYHDKCKHSYFVKRNGKKEKAIIENNDCGNCSVCWKLSKTSHELKSKAVDLINMYNKNFENISSNISYNLFDLENIFYYWLYTE